MLVEDLAHFEQLKVFAAISARRVGKVAAKWMHDQGKAPEGALRRCNDHFPYAASPGFFFGDLDTLPGMAHASALDYDDILTRLFPWLRDVARAYLPSSSSHVYRGSSLVSPKTGFHLLFGVTRADRVPALGNRMFQRAFDAGFGHQLVMADGDRDPRTLIDRYVWQGSRLDFAFGAALGEGLRWRPEAGSLILDGRPYLDNAKVLPLDMQQWKASSLAYAKTLAATDKEASEARRSRIERDIQDSVSSGTDPKEALATALQAHNEDYRVLQGSYRLTLNNFNTVTVDEVLDSPELYHGMTIRPPGEPEYGAGP
jgi:hypothetical protein